MSVNSFASLQLNPSIMRALDDAGYTEPTPIQLEAIPMVLAGVDLLATAQTGTGKTAAFALPMLHRLSERTTPRGRPIRGLILTPTRELAVQIDENLRAYGKHLKIRSTVVMGGVPAGPQFKALGKRPDILVATPGRLLDLMSQGAVKLGEVEFLVLDEADRMLDMGFINDVRKIVNKIPKERQSLLFSATLSGEITRLASNLLKDPQRIEISPPSSVSDDIAQKVLYVERINKRALLADVLKGSEVLRALVFTRTKRRADRLSKQLSQDGINAAAIHSDKSQGARQKALAAFDRGRVRVLVGTDVVARGIDVDGISHVINYELPEDPENYVHRIGRTARAGAKGIAISFCEAEEVTLLHGIESLTSRQLTPDDDHRYHSEGAALLHKRGIGRNGTKKRYGKSQPLVVIDPMKQKDRPRTYGRKRAAGGRKRSLV
jgi:ATP-dependent RNA helicase RhlE